MQNMLKIIETHAVELGEKLTVDIPLASIAEDIVNNGTVYCIKNCIRHTSIDYLRKKVFDYYSRIPQISQSYDTPSPSINCHSIERGISRLQKTMHYFHVYIFHKMEALPPELKPHITGLFSSMASLYNELTFQKRELATIHDDGTQFRFQIFQYPRGGGMFSSHVHALFPQKIGLILGFSKRGRDFYESDVGFEAPDGSIINTSHIHDMGDIMLFRVNLKHWVTPCDITEPLIENQSSGRWSAVLAVY